MKIPLLFSRKKKSAERELAPQLTLAQRRALEIPGASGNLPNATYDEMELDSMVQTALTIKRLAVLAAPFKVVIDESNPEAVRRRKFVEQNFNQMVGNPTTILSAAMDAFSKGWSVQEIVWEEREGKIWLHSVEPKDPANFGIQSDAYGKTIGLKLQLPGETPIDLPKEKFVTYINRKSYSRPKGRSDLDAAYRHWRAKRSLLNAWKAHLERFASPTVLGKFQRGLPHEEQSSILRALENLHDNTAIVFPNEIDIDLLNTKNAQNESFLDALEYHNREMARSILGQTLTTDEGRRVGSLALGKVHLQVLLLQVVSIRKELADQVMTEQIIRPLVELNFGKGPIPRFEFGETVLEAFSTGKV